jgi:hypothetical protein
MRQVMGDDFCKNKGVEICGEEYIGLATITAAEIRRQGSLVFDYREDFLGHAHIDHQLPPIQKDEPPSAEALQRYQDRWSRLAAAAVFQKDPLPKVPGWAGEPLRLASPLLLIDASTQKWRRSLIPPGGEVNASRWKEIRVS